MKLVTQFKRKSCQYQTKTTTRQDKPHFNRRFLFWNLSSISFSLDFVYRKESLANICSSSKNILSLLSLFSLIFVSINFSLVVLNSKWNSILQLLRLQSWIDSHLIYPLAYWQWFRISKKGILEITCTKRILKKERKVFNSTIDESGCHLVFDLP